MSEPRPPDRSVKRDLKFPSAYYSIHGKEGQSITGSPPRIGWKLPLIVTVFGVAIVAGLIFTLSKVEPTRPWLDLVSVSVDMDEGFLYILLKTRASDSEPPWEEVRYLVGFDTYDAERGARRLPELGTKIGSGIEFLLDIGGPGATELLVVEGYDPYDGEKPIVSPRNFDGSFRRLSFTSNRQRFTRAGSEIPAIEISRGGLRYGSQDSSAPAWDTRTDIAVGAGTIELRIPWGLLNVSDPSSRRVLHSESHGRENIQTTHTNGFRIYTYSINRRSQKTADAIPSPPTNAPLYRWETWDAPNYVTEPKLGFAPIRDTIHALPDHPEITDEDDDS